MCVTGVHGVMETQRDEGLKAILNNSFLTTPDGMPTVWVGRWQGFGGMERVYGPDLMLEICRLSLARRYDNARVDAACRRGILIKARSVASIRSILKNGLDRAFSTRRPTTSPCATAISAVRAISTEPRRSQC